MSERALLLGGILVLVAGENGSRQLSQALGVLNSFFFFCGPVFFRVLVEVLSSSVYLLMYLWRMTNEPAISFLIPIS